MRPLVSIITACCNGSAYIDRYAASILGQTYMPLEVVFVDDGSTDDTCRRIHEKLPQFTAKDIAFHYIRQENSGQAAATNAALSRIRGEYFSLYDVDDLMEPECIEHRAAFLAAHPECGMVRSNAWRIYAASPERKTRFLNRETASVANIFYEVLRNEISAFPIFYLFRTRDFFKIYPAKRIYPSRYTQDVQAVLPMAYAYPCGYLPECLGTYWHHPDSHSHAPRTAAAKLALWRGWEDVWLRVLEGMPMQNTERAKCMDMVRQRFGKIAGFWQLAGRWRSLANLPREYAEKRYFIYGAGNEGSDVAGLLREKGLHLAAFLDGDESRHGSYHDGLKVLSPRALAGEQAWQDKLIIIASCAYREEMNASLSAIGVPEQASVYYRDFFAQVLDDGEGG